MASNRPKRGEKIAMATAMTSRKEAKTSSEQSKDVQQKIQELRELFADAPEIGKPEPAP